MRWQEWLRFTWRHTTSRVLEETKCQIQTRSDPESKSNFKAKDKTNFSNSGSKSQNKTSNVKGKTDNTNIRCYNCQSLGHKADRCTKPKKTKMLHLLD